MFGILGKGFGLYGYLPAIVSLGESVGTLSAYKDYIEERDDISDLSKHIQYFNNQDDLIEKSDSLVIARRPKDQYRLVKKILNDQIKLNLFLEKPLTPSCTTSQYLFNKLQSGEYNYRIGYTVEFTDWFFDVVNLLNNQSFKNLELEIFWDFHAYHYINKINTWKKNPFQGGGAFKFYGTHLVYLLANVGKWDNVKMESFRHSLEDEYMFLLSGKNKTRKFNISCNSCSPGKSVFDVKVKSNGKSIFHCALTDPLFRNSNLKQRDSRIPMLKALISSMNSKVDYPKLYLELFKITELAIDNQYINLSKH
jgi:predicted dehydrogenase